MTRRLGCPVSHHGTNSRYTGGCRCAKCTEAARAYQAGYRERLRIWAAEHPNEIPHGTHNAYQNIGCRCSPCREAGTTYRQEWRARRTS